MPTPLPVSVVICTYNRCESLRRTLDKFLALAVPQGLEWELVLVDNNSPDATRAVCSGYESRLPLRYFFEPRQGKSCALNRAMHEARGEWLLFTDDDVDPSPGWLHTYCEAFQQHPDASFFGGKVIPRWEAPPPPWLEQYSRTLLAGPSIYLDLGEAPLKISRRTDKMFFGSNMAIKTCALVDVQGFLESLSHKGNVILGMEDADVIWRMMDRGGWGFYLPNAVVHHRNSPERATEAFIRRWYFAYGKGEVMTGQLSADNLLWDAPRWAWRAFVISGVRYLLTRLVCKPEVWLGAEIGAAKCWGIISEFRRARPAGEKPRPASGRTPDGPSNP